MSRSRDKIRKHARKIANLNNSVTEFKSTHSLSFEVAPYDLQLPGDQWIRFRIGTCHGLWRGTHREYQILAVINEEPGNGHFEDVIDWFERSAKRDNRNLMFMEMINDEFRDHLINKRGFEITSNNVIKRYI